MFTARGISAVGAHHTGSVGVTGSSPVCSTKNTKTPSVTYGQVLGEQCSPAELVTEGVFVFGSACGTRRTMRFIHVILRN